MYDQTGWSGGNALGFIQEVLSLNLGQDTGYPEFLVVFLNPFWQC
jgi:hypothetical protein